MSGQADPTNASPVNFTAIFSEAVTGFTGADVSFAGSTAPGTLAAAVSGTGPTYDVAVSGMTGPGTVVVSIRANSATDAAGNANAASTSTDNTVTFDGTPPTCAITAVRRHLRRRRARAATRWTSPSRTPTAACRP